MPENIQVPQLYTVGVGQTLTINFARAISVFSSGGTSTIVNSDSQTMTLSDGLTIDLMADNGNTLGIITITSASSALVGVVSGICDLV